MAYFEEDEDQRQNPRYSGGGSAAVRAGTGARGSGFTNFSALQGANTDTNARLLGASNPLTSNVRGELDKKQNEASAVGSGWKPKELGGIESLVASNNQDELKTGINQKFDGPRVGSIDLAGVQSFADMKKLGDPRAAGALMADKGSGYSGGQRAFDSALFSGATATGDINSQTQRFRDQSDDSDKLFSANVGKADTQAANASKGFRDALKSKYDRIIAGIDSRVGNELAGEKLATTKSNKGLADGYKNQVVGKTGLANRANQISQEESDWLGTLGGVIGTDTIARDGNYKRAGTETVFDPMLKYQQREARTQEAARAEMAKNEDLMTPAQKAESKKIADKMGIGSKGRAAVERGQRGNQKNKKEGSY